MATGSGRDEERVPAQPLAGGIAGGPGPTPPGFTDGTEPRPPAPGEESALRPAEEHGPEAGEQAGPGRKDVDGGGT